MAATSSSPPLLASHAPSVSNPSNPAQSCSLLPASPSLVSLRSALASSQPANPSLTTPPPSSPLHHPCHPAAVAAPPPSRWVHLFQRASNASSATNLERFSPVFVNGVAQVPSAVVEEGVSKWKQFLVGSFLGKKMPFFMVKKELEKILKCKDAFELSSDNERFFIELRNPDHRQFLLDGGPVFIAGRIMLIREWCSSIEKQQDHHKSIPLWINLELPRELWTLSGISYSASLFGLPLGMDAFTAKMTKMKFARVCVEVAADFQFPESIPVDLESRVDVVKAEYKWKPEICSKCHRFGHNELKCSLNPAQTHQNARAAGTGRRWHLAKQQNAEPAMVEAGGAGVIATEGRASHPVAFTGTHPLASNTTFTISGEKRSETANRFSVLGNLDEDLSDSVVHPEPHAEVCHIVAVPQSEDCTTVETGEVRQGTNSAETENFLDNVSNCMEICNVVVNSLAADATTNLVQTLTAESIQGGDIQRKCLVDKGGTIDTSNPDTWTDAMREADQKIASVLSRMENPEPAKPKSSKVDLRVKLVRGNSGAPIRSSSRNKR